MKLIKVIAFMLMSIASKAQVSKITLQASGLTCSMCSNAINKSLKTLPFVQKITSNIKTSSFEIDVKANATANFDDIKKKVEDAGFSVAKLVADVNFKSAAVENDTHIKVGNAFYHFLNIKNQTLDGTKQIKILDKGFVTAKEFKKNAALTKMKCYETGKASSCCSKDGINEGERIYHVTI